MKKRVLSMISIFALSVSLAACGEAKEASAGGEAEETVLRVGYFGQGPYSTQLAVAEKKGYFAEAFADDNVKIEYYSFASGPAMNEAFLAGELDAAHGIGDQPAISGIANGNGSIIVSRVVKNARGIGITTDFDSDIASVAELKGKTVALPIGTAAQKCFNLMIQDAGLAEGDVEVINLTKHDEISAAYEKNEIDAAVVSDIAYTIESDEANQICRLLTDFTDHPNYAYLEFQKEFIEGHEELVKQFLGALKQANDWYNENTEEGNELVAEFDGVEVSDVELANASVDFGLGIDEADIENFTQTYDFMKENDILPEEIEDISSIYNEKLYSDAVK